MKQSEKIFKEYDVFHDVHNETFRFVRHSDKSNLIFAWHIIQDGTLSCEAKFIALSPHQVGKSSLQSLDLWDNIDSELKKDIELNSFSKNNAINPTGSIRKTKKEYLDIPRNIECSNESCKNTQYIAPGVFFKKAQLESAGEERSKRIEEFLSSYKCSTCSPRSKGKKANPLYKGIPKKTKCLSCGKNCTLNAKSMYEKHKGNIEEIKKSCSEYLCRQCNSKLNKKY